MPVVFDSGSTNLRLFSESRYAEPICSTEGSEKVLPIEGKAFALLRARFTRASFCLLSQTRSDGKHRSRYLEGLITESLLPGLELTPRRRAPPRRPRAP